MRWKVIRGISIATAILMMAGCSGPVPSGGRRSTPTPSTARTSVTPVGADITVAVSPGTALDTDVPGVGRITAPAGTFSAAGSITLRREQADFSAASGLQAAGTGVDVTFQGTTLVKPLELDFAPHAAASDPSAIPVVAHQADDGTWNVIPAVLGPDGTFTVTTSSFSLNIPSWANPLAWWRSFESTMASAVGGRTDPLTCSGAPGWFHLDASHSDLVHVCAITNHAPDGREVGEVQIKSNRGVSLEVTVPGMPAYVWVEDQPWAYRQYLGRTLGYDPNQTVILPAGATMTVGYPQESTSLPFSFFVTGASGRAFADTLIRALFDFAGDGLDKVDERIAVGYTEIKCATDLGLGGSGFKLGVAALKGFLGCWTGAVAGDLKDPKTALQIASRFQDTPDVGKLVASAKAVEGLGWLTTLWPLFQAGWGNVIDKLNELFSDGATALVTFHTDPAPPGATHSSPPASGGSGGSTSGGASGGTGGTGGSTGGTGPGPSPTVHLAQGPAAPQGYRYSVQLSGFPSNASVSVTCYDSASPGGFFTFNLPTDGTGDGSTQNQCYSGDGPDHWVVANGYQSNHVQWGAAPPPPPPPSTWSETVGGVTNTWSNYVNAGGTHGPTIQPSTTVQIACKVTGFRVADGDTWWYRIASSGWDGNFYASADAFYNNGQTSGTLKGTPFVDNAVPNC